ncbi:MAG TPA: hypothetical protein VN914_10215 [Polyangia bacterium]|nr:hypothetical protein [Polyangia bacterium]
MKKEYDFAGGVRGKYVTQFARGPNVVVLAPDVAEFFKTAKAVNDALRTTMSKKRRKPRRTGRRPAR